MTTENSTESLVVAKTRKPRSPNKPKTTEKLIELANKALNRLVGKQQAAIEAAVERVKERFVEKRQEFYASLPDDVRVGVDPDFELPTATAADPVVAEEVAAE